ncbi:Destabilase [Popillia japonica]|uniref:lysozyme n=1 Tax=Popillia japonica TaxID=7064 RepID=A0AAW1JDJ4_POPJA
MLVTYNGIYYVVFFVLLLMCDEFNSQEDIYVSNLNIRCMKCLCAASTGCPAEPLGCASGYCGPFQISKQYWLDAVKGTPLDTNDDATYETCVNTYDCASKVVKYYIARFAKDCNSDGVTTCEDFLMINYNGGYNCGSSLYRNPSSMIYLKRFTNCTENFVF